MLLKAVMSDAAAPILKPVMAPAVNVGEAADLCTDAMRKLDALLAELKQKQGL